jgi:hypothetical protein
MVRRTTAPQLARQPGSVIPVGISADGGTVAVLARVGGAVHMKRPEFYLSLIWLGAIGVLANLLVALYGYLRFGGGCEPPLFAAAMVTLLTAWLFVPYRHYKDIERT